MPFISRDPRQYRPTNPGQEWLNQLRSGGRITASLPLLDATGSFTDRLKAPGAKWRERQAAGQRARAASGTYAEPQSRIPGAPTLGTIQASARPSATPSVASVISSLRPRGQGFIEEIAQGPPMTDRPPEQVYLNQITGRYEAMPSAAEWNAGATTIPVQDRTDVGDGGGGFFSDVGGYLGGPGMGNALIGAGGAMMEAAGQPGATFGGSLGTGLRGFADERARFQASEAARRQAAQEGQTSPQELRDRQNTVRAMLAQRQVPRDQWPQYLARVVTQKGYEGVLDELAPPEAADPIAPTAPSRNIASMQAARARLQELISAGVAEDDPEMILAKQAVNDWELEMGVRQLPGGDDLSTGQKEWLDYVALRKQEDPNYVPTAAELMNFRTGGLTAPGRVTRRSPGEVTADRLASTDAMKWETTDKAMYLKRYDQLNEVMGSLQFSIDNPNSPRLTGFTTGTLQNIESLRALNPQAADAFDNVRNVVFEGLKETLGGQFAEREGERLVAAAYNPYLPPEMNIKRLRRLLGEMQMIASSRDSRARHMRKNNFSISGWVDPYGDMIEDPNAVQIANTLIDPTDYELIDDPTARIAAMSEDVDRLSRAELEALFNTVFKEDENATYTVLEEQLLDLISDRY